MNRTFPTHSATMAFHALESARASAAPLGSAVRAGMCNVMPADASLGLPRTLLRGLLLRPAR